MEKINKAKAYRNFKNNIPFVICASKISPYSDFAYDVEPTRIKEGFAVYPESPRLYSNDDDTKECFERFLANFYSYNCTEETGLRISYYI